MYSIETFNKKLQREFDGRLRCRYVQHRDEYHIEQKVYKSVLPPFRINSEDDDAIRARDGYSFVMRIRRGDRMPCPDCNLTIKVPVRHTGVAECTYCQVRGKDGKHMAAYFPLDDYLIMELRAMDPYKGWSEDRLKLIDEENRKIMESRKKDFDNQIEAITNDYYKRMVGIPQVGYTGRSR